MKENWNGVEAVIFNIFCRIKVMYSSSKLSKIGHNISEIVNLNFKCRETFSWNVCEHYNHGTGILCWNYECSKLSTTSTLEINTYTLHMGLCVNYFFFSKSEKVEWLFFTLCVFYFEISSPKMYSCRECGQCYEEFGINDVIKLIVKLSLVQTNNNNNSCYLRLNWYHNQHILNCFIIN